MATKVYTCIACGGKDFTAYSKGLIKCDACGLVCAKEMPSSKEVQELYQKDYFFGMEYSDYKADRAALESNFKSRIKRMTDIIHPDATVVEIGCAYGYFLNLIKDKVAHHVGFDVSEDGVAYSRKEFGLNAHTTDFLDYDFKDNSVDAVFMWDVIEHLVDPDKYIEKIAKILKPGGSYVFTTGNIGALLPRMRKGKWRMIHPPTHLYYFDPSTAAKLLKKHGLEIKQVKHKGITRNAGSVANQIICNRKVAGKSTGLLEHGLKTAEKARLTKLNIPLNTLDIMEVTATLKK